MAKRPTRRKRKSTTNKYRSGSEVICAAELDRKKIKYAYEPERFSYVVEKTYLPDFHLEEYGFYIEVKGRFTAYDRSKHLAIKAQRPELDIRFIFDNPNQKLYKGSKSTYADWCKKYGFLFSSKAEGVPKKWVRK